MHRRPILLTFVAVLAAVFWTRTARADLNVVTTVPTLAAIAKEVGGDHAEVTSLSLHTQDPHFVDAKPSLALELNKADLLLLVGLQLEVGWLPTLQKGARNPKVQTGASGYLDCSKFARLLEKPKNVDRSKGDVHPGGNPHYYFDPRQIAHVAVGVAGRMAELDEDNADAYKKNLKKLLKGIHKARILLRKKLKDYRGEKVVSYHRSWVYLAEWLGIEEIAYLEPKPGIPPNPGHVAKVVKKARKHKVKVILQESYYPDSTSKKVAKLVGAELVVLPGGVNFRGGESLVAHVTNLVSLLKKGFD
jgi:zinc/manganese transport system substrate-binding protein